MNPLSDLERLVAAIEHQGANIAPTYQEYMPIASANDCGETGRTFFHRICRLSEKYLYEEADKLYDHALKAGNGRNGLGSVFHWAEIAGVKTDKQLADTFRQYLRENKNPSNLQAPLTPTHAHTYAREDLPPAFPDYPWPPFIKQMIDCGNSIAQREILLLGVFTVLGGTFVPVYSTEEAGTGIIRTKIHVPMPTNLHRSASRLRKRSLDMGQAPS